MAGGPRGLTRTTAATTPAEATMIISHDLGTTGDKATLVSNDGDLVAAVTASYPTDFGPRGKAEQDAEHWWTGLCTATKGLLDQATVKPENIDVVSFSGQMMGA